MHGIWIIGSVVAISRGVPVVAVIVAGFIYVFLFARRKPAGG
jgi:hypothetical protein